MGAEKTRPFVQQRRQIIAEILREKGRASVAALAEQLGVSQLTVRRDLGYLEERGIASRRYGEAVLAERSQRDEEPAEAGPLEPQKAAIAKAAAKLVLDHELLFLNTSSTALAVVPHITAEGVTVVTNSARAQRLPIPPSGMILVTGGEIRPPRGVLSGEFALNNVRSVAASTCFVGCAGISLTAGVTSTTQQEATVNSLMVERSDRLVLLADSSKLGIGAGFSYAPLNRVALLITDTGATDEDVQVLLEAGIHEIRRVEPEA
ncbi:MAG: DeoR/GlpR family DNA-binding transcription regulator [Coriobacteriaceae bacterium]|nr:DeoR/GlpR family DNA-binding transcription regulator [Coriobacteriaceae bacterium]MCI7438602.1 DeoR/GlpR family DNA-binding transcription regulator [Coriobacteriaceae bacterium]MDD7584778.1 DeoR/GlpR family DNA-binding transcription regulator [Coriobacteriaceae bacterium]